jgi:hypothetical protein
VAFGAFGLLGEGSSFIVLMGIYPRLPNFLASFCWIIEASHSVMANARRGLPLLCRHHQEGIRLGSVRLMSIIYRVRTKCSSSLWHAPPKWFLSTFCLRSSFLYLVSIDAAASYFRIQYHVKDERRKPHHRTRRGQAFCVSLWYSVTTSMEASQQAMWDAF